MKRISTWSADDNHRLRMMAKAGWSVQMAAAQLERLPYDTETRAEVLGVKLADRTAGKQHDATRVAAGNAAEAVAASQVRKVPRDVLP